MEIGLTGRLIIRCDDCGSKYEIDRESLDEESCAYERSMGEEIEYDFYGEHQCDSCGNLMRFSVKVFEYPMGAINYFDKEGNGCDILEAPEAVINYYDYEFDFYDEDEIREEVNRACLKKRKSIEFPQESLRSLLQKYFHNRGIV